MKCLTCYEMMASIGHGMFHCAKCGSLKLPDGTPGDFVVPVDAIPKSVLSAWSKDLEDYLVRAYNQRDDAYFHSCILKLRHLLTLLERHRRWHQKVGCSGYPECYVCAMED